MSTIRFTQTTRLTPDGGKGVLKKSFVNSVKAIEARNNAASGR